MTPGQWLAALSAGVALAVAGYAWRRDHGAAMVALGFAACVVMMRVFKGYLPPDLHLIGFAAIWVAFGSWVVPRHPVAGALLVISGLCYAGVAAANWPTHYGIPLMFASDVSGYAALAALLWGIGGGKSARPDAADLGRHPRGRRVLASRRVHLGQEKKAG